MSREALHTRLLVQYEIYTQAFLLGFSELLKQNARESHSKRKVARWNRAGRNLLLRVVW